MPSLDDRDALAPSSLQRRSLRAARLVALGLAPLAAGCIAATPGATP